MTFEDESSRVTVAIVEGKAYWVYDNAMWTTIVDEHGEPDRTSATPVDTDDMTYQEIKMHMAILDSLQRESEKE